MLTKTPHLFDDATQVTAGDSRWQGKTSDGLLGLCRPVRRRTAATILRALIDHPQRAGDPLALTVNFCAPVAQGAFDLDVRLVKANRSSQHWCVEMTQGGGEVATLATAVFAERRPSWSHQQAPFPRATPFEQTLPYPKIAAPGPSSMISASSRANRVWPARRPQAELERLFQTVDRRPRAAKDRHAVADVDVGRVLRPHLPRQARTGAVRHGVDDDLFPRRRRTISPPKTSPACWRWPTPRFSTRVMATRTANCGRRTDACSQPRRRSRISRRRGTSASIS